MHVKNVGITFLGHIFLVPIPFEWYQNTSKCGTAHGVSMKPTVCTGFA